MLLVFEFLGTTELLVIAAVALLVFGPRKLPEIGRTVGRALAEFRRASEDFKRTWEYEVEMERSSESATHIEQAGTASPAVLPEGDASGVWGGDGGALNATEEQTVARGLTDSETAAEEVEEAAGTDNSASDSKQDWL